MANRSYLYATNIIPGTNPGGLDLKVCGISEWAYDIPLVYKLLLAGNPQSCPSAIWDMQGDCALVGDYAQGVERLRQFLTQIKHPLAVPLVKEALAFLNNKEHKNIWFLLECTEIFYMDEDPPEQQNQALLAEIRNSDALAGQTLQTLQAAVPPPAPAQGLFARLFGSKPKLRPEDDAFLNAIIELGLGDWSTVLFHDLGK